MVKRLNKKFGKKLADYHGYTTSLLRGLTLRHYKIAIDFFSANNTNELIRLRLLNCNSSNIVLL
jgi:hypothetical protein